MATQDDASKETSMRLAEILSDLVSLRVCDPAAALALVSARSTSSQTTTSTDDDQDPELTRAKDLLKLHFEVKQAHKRGELRSGLEAARASVDRAVGG